MWSPEIVHDHSLESWADSNNVSVSWRKRPLLFFQKFACANAGHCILETLYPLYLDILTWLVPLCAGDSRCDPFNNDLLMVEPHFGSDCGCGSAATHPECANEQQQAQCERNSKVLELMSNNPPHYLNEIGSESAECWPSAHAGHGSLSPYHTGDNHWPHASSYLRGFRDSIYSRLNLSPSHELKKLRETRFFIHRIVNVLVHAKLKGRRRLLGLDAFAKQINGTRYSSLNNQTFSLNVKLVQWEHLPVFRDQVELMQWADVFVSSPGSGGINALFLSDGTAMVSSVLCGSSAESCTTFEFELIHAHVPYYTFFALAIGNATAELVHNADTRQEDLEVQLNPEHASFRLSQAIALVTRPGSSNG